MTVFPLATGRITFFRQVTKHGNVHLLSQTFFIGKRLKGEYVKVLLDTQLADLTVYRQERIFKRFPYPFLKKVTVIPVSTNGGCHTHSVSNALAALSIFTRMSYALSVRNNGDQRDAGAAVHGTHLHLLPSL